MQKASKLIIPGVILLLAAVIYVLSSMTGSDKEGNPTISATPSPKSGTTTTKSSQRRVPDGKTQDPGPGMGATNPETTDLSGNPESKERLLDEINEFAVTYDAKELPKIEPYLLHPDPEIRQAAINGMITLGDPSAGALMRNAASRAATPQDAVKLLEAADYVELPPATIFLKKK